MSRNRNRDEQRRAYDEQMAAERQAEAEELARKDALDLPYLIDMETHTIADVKYVLLRLAKAQALQLELLKRLINGTSV